jgi:uncharacterized membrane protein
LAGLSLALASMARMRRGATHAQNVISSLRRAGEIVAIAVAFRVAVFVLSGFSNPRNLLRVDILNCIGLSMVIVTLAVLILRSLAARLVLGTLLAIFFSALAPITWDVMRVDALPFVLQGYLSGRVHEAMFPLFPWAAFTALGAVCGSILATGVQKEREGLTVASLAALSAGLFYVGSWLDRQPSPYPHDDYWHTSPSFFWMRAGVLLLLLGLAYGWDRLPLAAWPSALRQFGRASLLVYMVHVELVYGFASHAWKRSMNIRTASCAVVVLMLLMLLLAWLRTDGFVLLRGRWKGSSKTQRA